MTLEESPPWDNPVNLETHIEDLGGGVYELYVGNTAVVKIDWVNGVRQCRWQVYGPADLDRSIAMMTGFLHLTALIGNEEGAYVRPPAQEVPNTPKRGKLKWRTSKTIPKSRT